ncbi:GNAT family N-acetyltransferase [Paenibacillus aurantius]|uniref:GNAT family N-acetyltransferase n=1 Tax=Paenibacillus aurantius TaxID=2918900 RepID=A0AA96L9R4_9BACL|nr:GNAT family N-acetyltransferase [Paenibacillus aurantius]WNQ09622.1 GNAT family N-acetyltransferase [Paenibacillus aurantius]
MTGVWFTEEVLEETRRDLLFQDLMCAEIDGQVTSFIVYTSSEGSMIISLMGTQPMHHRKGYGSLLLQSLFQYGKQLGFKKVVAMTVPPQAKPVYEQTVSFYKKHGFTIEKEYTELWQSGTIQLVKLLR